MPPESTSFIPKTGVKTVQRTRSTKRIYVLAYISYIVFFSALFAVVGVYVYGAIVSRDLTNTKTQLTAEQQRFSPADIDRVRQLDVRLQTADRLINESTAPSRIFPDIEAIVASNIAFTGMEYVQLPNRQFEINLTGRAGSFNEIIGQRNLLESSALLQDAKITQYDYSVAGEGGGGSATGQATLTFVLSDTRDLSTIPYAPAAEALLMNATGTEPAAVIIEGTVSSGQTATTSAPASNTSPNQN